MTTLARASIIISLGNFANFLVSAGKSIVVAKYFGTGNELDSFFIAYIPFLILNGILVSSMQYSIIPVIVDLSEKGEERMGILLFNSFFTLSVIIFLSLGVLMFLFSESIVGLLAPGFGTEKTRLAGKILRIISPAIVISGASEIINSLFHSKRKFGLPIFGGLVNISLSFLYLLIFLYQGIHALAFGMVLGSCAQCGISLWGAYRERMGVALTYRFANVGFPLVFHNLVPMFLSILFTNVNLAVDQIMASVLPAGSVSALNYASNMNNIFHQVFIYSIGSAVLPFLSHYVAKGNLVEMKNTFKLGIRVVFYILLPITIIILIVGEPVVELVFQRGVFDNYSTLFVSNAWKAFSLGMIAMGVGILGVRILTALQMTKVLAYISFFNIFMNVTLNWVLMKFYGHVGIALSTSISYLVSSILIMVSIYKIIGDMQLEELLIPLKKILYWASLSGIVNYIVLFLLSFIQSRIFAALFSAMIGLSLYLIVSWKEKSMEFQIIVDNLRFKDKPA